MKKIIALTVLWLVICLVGLYFLTSIDLDYGYNFLWFVLWCVLLIIITTCIVHLTLTQKVAHNVRLKTRKELGCPGPGCNDQGCPYHYADKTK